MPKPLHFLREQFLEVLPPTIFFFIGFSLILVTKTLILAQQGIEFSGFAKAVVGALLVGKVVLVVDKIPLVNRYPEKPLIYNTLWKTGIYLVATMIVRYLEHLIRFGREAGSLAAAHHRIWTELDWNQFGVIHLWLSVLIFVYCAGRELVLFIGKEKALHMFFGYRGSVV